MRNKVLTLLFAICLVLSMIPAADAAQIGDYPALTYGVEQETGCTGEYTYFTFTPETDGYYRFYTVSNETINGTLFDADMNVLRSSQSCWDEWHIHDNSSDVCMTRSLTAGETYVLGIKLPNSGFEKIIVGVGCPHYYVLDRTVEATCCQDGARIYVCERCGDEGSTPIYAYPYTKESITRAPTCSREGVLTYTCNDCGRSWNEPIKTVPHTFNADLVCTVCGYKLTGTNTWSDGNGNSVDWTYDKGVLTITGFGDIPGVSYEYDEYWEPVYIVDTPWVSLPVAEVVFGEGITGISNALFMGCKTLKEITLPDTLIHIGSYAFQGCSGLTAVDLPDGLEDIYDCGFADCDLREVRLPATFEDWYLHSIFAGNNNLERFEVAEGNPELSADEQGVLYSNDGTCLELIPYGFQGTYTMPAKVTSYVGGMICDCLKLEAIVVEEGNEEFFSEDGLLYGDYYEWVYDEETWEGTDVYMGKELLACPPAKELGSFVVPEWVVHIEESVFANNQTLTELSIPAGCSYFDVASIAEDCMNLEAVWIGEGNEKYFSDENGLVFNGEKYWQFEAGYFEADFLQTFEPGSILCWFPSGRTGYYAIPEGIKALDSGCFRNSGLSAVRFPTTMEFFFPYAMNRNGGKTAIEWIQFTGEKPGSDGGPMDGGCTFNDLDAVVYYPGWLESWSDPMLPECEDNLTYIPYAQGKEPVYTPFRDVPGTSFCAASVAWAVENGITNGLTANSFGPNATCNRAQVVTFLWRAAGSPAPVSTTHDFVDVIPGSFYEKAVLWAVENGITTGANATHFDPTGDCNRAQVVTFLYRTFKSPAVEKTDNPFSDVPEKSWYTAPVLWAVEKGITNGLTATTFGPTAVCNRAQVVTFLYRAFEG